MRQCSSRRSRSWATGVLPGTGSLGNLRGLHKLFNYYRMTRHELLGTVHIGRTKALCLLVDDSAHDQRIQHEVPGYVGQLRAENEVHLPFPLAAPPSLRPCPAGRGQGQNRGDRTGRPVAGDGAIPLVRCPLGARCSVLGATAVWLAGLTKGSEPQSGVARAVGNIGFVVAVLVVVATFVGDIGSFVG
jgi:hypothetical protein